MPPITPEDFVCEVIKYGKNYDYMILKICIFLLFCQQILSIVICLLFYAVGATAEEGQRQIKFESKTKSFLPIKTPISLRKSDSLISCSHYCAREKRCKSENFIEDEKTCSLLDKTRLTNPQLLLREQVGAIHIEKAGDVAAVVRSSTIGPLNNRTNKRNKERGVKTIELLHIAVQ